MKAWNLLAPLLVAALRRLDGPTLDRVVRAARARGPGTRPPKPPRQVAQMRFPLLPPPLT